MYPEVTCHTFYHILVAVAHLQFRSTKSNLSLIDNYSSMICLLHFITFSKSDVTVTNMNTQLTKFVMIICLLSFKCYTIDNQFH